MRKIKIKLTRIEHTNVNLKHFKRISINFSLFNEIFPVIFSLCIFQQWNWTHTRARKLESNERRNEKWNSMNWKCWSDKELMCVDGAIVVVHNVKIVIVMKCKMRTVNSYHFVDCRFYFYYFHFERFFSFRLSIQNKRFSCFLLTRPHSSANVFTLLMESRLMKV